MLPGLSKGALRQRLWRSGGEAAGCSRNVTAREAMELGLGTRATLLLSEQVRRA